MESRFGHDFTRVRIHADGAAARLARTLNAVAYTAGDHVGFADGTYAPHTSRGRRVLAHELTHVVQQHRGGAAPEMSPESATERDADRAAAAVTSASASVEVTGGTGVGLARQAVDEPELLGLDQSVLFPPETEERRAVSPPDAPPALRRVIEDTGIAQPLGDEAPAVLWLGEPPSDRIAQSAAPIMAGLRNGKAVVTVEPAESPQPSTDDASEDFRRALNRRLLATGAGRPIPNPTRPPSTFESQEVKERGFYPVFDPSTGDPVAYKLDRAGYHEVRDSEGNRISSSEAPLEQPAMDPIDLAAPALGSFGGKTLRLAAGALGRRGAARALSRPILKHRLFGNRPQPPSQIDEKLLELGPAAVAAEGPSVQHAARKASGDAYIRVRFEQEAENRGRKFLGRLEPGELFYKPLDLTSPFLEEGRGATSQFGDIIVSRVGSQSAQAVARNHELVHRFFAPRFRYFRDERIAFAARAAKINPFLIYLEEALAESNALIRARGLKGAKGALIEGFAFPVKDGYVTWRQAAVGGVVTASVPAGLIWMGKRKIDASLGLR